MSAAPTHDYAAARARFAAWQAAEPPEVDPLSVMTLRDHGQRTPAAVALLHGYTNSPHQWDLFGEKLHARGYNVLIPRAPEHGLRDPLTPRLAALTRAALLAYLDETLAILTGLGERVAVVGLSMGGMLAGWAAQTRPEVDFAMLVAPALGLRLIPARLTRPAARLALRRPNAFIWWDRALTVDTPRPITLYPRFSTHGLAEVLLLGQNLLKAARRSPPQAKRIFIATNPRDQVVDWRVALRLAQAWQAWGTIPVETYTFEAQRNFLHDMIDPTQPRQQVALSHAILLELLTAAFPAA
jgi:pimeloyl-ACP methyl ester carboxylesterase